MPNLGNFDDPILPHSPRYYWKCPYCAYDLTAVTEGGRRSLSQYHMDRHLRDSREKMVAFANAPIHPPEYYQTLRLSWADIQFLRTRGIKIEADMEWIDCQW